MSVDWQIFCWIDLMLCRYGYPGKISMNTDVNNNPGSVEGRTYIVGREGHIYLGDSSVSRQHAEIKFIDGKIRLRDLNSSNGIYVIKDKQAIRFKEGFVSSHQPIVIGRKQCTVQSLLAVLGILAD